LLSRGHFHRALAEAEAGLAAPPSDLSPSQRRDLAQVRRESALLADLSAESVEEILGNLAALPEDERAAAFRRRYAGKALVFDTDVARTAAGRYRAAWRVLPARGEGRLDLDGLRLLDTLPLGEPRRLVFGARLRDATQEAPAAWLVHFESDSGVLLTDPDAARLCCPALADATSAALLRRQRAWALAGDARGQ
jgi:hypothetical protein